MGLTPKQRSFVAEYVLDHNGAAAVRRAGYSTTHARQAAAQLMRNPTVLEAIRAADQVRRGNLGVSSDWIVSKLVEIVERSLVGDAIVGPGGRPVVIDGEIQMRWSPMAAVKALEILAKSLGMQVERQEVAVTGNVVYTLNLDRDLTSDADDDAVLEPGNGLKQLTTAENDPKQVENVEK
jgi:phage terminase small subunit